MDYWDLLVAAYYQIDLLRQKPSKFYALVYVWMLERTPHDKIEEWLTELREPLEWQDADSEAAVALESESFRAMQARSG